MGVSPKGVDLAERLALVERECSDVDQADGIGGACAGDRDHRASLRVADQQNRSVDLVDEAGDVLRVMGQPPQRVGPDPADRAPAGPQSPGPSTTNQRIRRARGRPSACPLIHSCPFLSGVDGGHGEPRIEPAAPD